MTSVGRRPSLVLTFTRDVTFVQPGYPISSTPKTLSRQNQTLSHSNFTISFQTKRHWDYFLPQTQNNLEWILSWRNRQPLSSECLLKMQTVIYSETLLPRPHVILTYTTLCLFTIVKNWSKKQRGWSMQEKLNYKYHIKFWTNSAWCTMLHFAPFLSYSFYCLVKWNKKVKGLNKTTSCKPFWNSKCYEFYIYRWIYCQHNYPSYVQLPK
jgi:hypothetical protein